MYTYPETDLDDQWSPLYIADSVYLCVLVLVVGIFWGLMSETDLDYQWPPLYIADRVLFVCNLVLVVGIFWG